ncbi:MAG TPA: MFS transporter [Spirochaetia bacterium]|nr:MFS transporter [Spirochaetia bacterium]
MMADVPTAADRGSPAFGQRPVRPGELPAIMKRHIATGTMGSAWGNLITGIIYVYFGNAVGLSRLQWGILTGIGSWVVVAQPIGTILADRLGSRRVFWFWTALTDRFLRMAGVLTAFLLWASGRPEAGVAFMSAICVGTLIGNLSPGPWYGWFVTIIPKEVQGAFWGRRDSWISLVVTLVVLPSGLVMDLVPPAYKTEMAAAILLAASCVGFMDLLIHQTLPEPPIRRVAVERRRKWFRRATFGMLVPLRDRRFRPWLVFTASWNLSQSLGGSLATLYLLENIGFKNDLLGGMFSMTITGLLATFVAARRLGRMVDRFGVKRVLKFSHLLWSFVPACWLVATPGHALFWVSLGSVLGTVFSTSATNASVKLATRFPSSDDGGMYIAVSTVMANVANGVGALLAGLFLTALGPWTLSVLGLVLSAFPVLFLISTVLRLATFLFLLPRVRTTTGTPEAESPFLLPLFFETVPGLNRLARGVRPIRRQLDRRPREPEDPAGRPLS